MGKFESLLKPLILLKSFYRNLPYNLHRLFAPGVYHMAQGINNVQETSLAEALVLRIQVQVCISPWRSGYKFL